MKYELGTLIESKKPHPCGNSIWTVVRVGADYKIKCNGCGRIVMLSYDDLNKRTKKILENS